MRWDFHRFYAHLNSFRGTVWHIHYTWPNLLMDNLRTSLNGMYVLYSFVMLFYNIGRYKYALTLILSKE